jgi:hypothetical protein
MPVSLYAQGKSLVAKGTHSLSDCCCSATGACCYCDICSITSPTVCSNIGGTYQGDHTTCDPTNPCPPYPVTDYCQCTAFGQVNFSLVVTAISGCPDDSCTGYSAFNGVSGGDTVYLGGCSGSPGGIGTVEVDFHCYRSVSPCPDGWYVDIFFNNCLGPTCETIQTCVGGIFGLAQFVGPGSPVGTYTLPLDCGGTAVLTVTYP